MDDIIERIRMDEMPFDHTFITRDGNEELCHATGDMVRFEWDSIYWCEYEDSYGDLHYGN